METIYLKFVYKLPLFFFIVNFHLISFVIIERKKNLKK